ncbi:MAG: Uma2 family endonuclease [Leptospiraceae bacterium]|nr:Uma2 family endonuclease [Leptospiraceae bacterium]
MTELYKYLKYVSMSVELLRSFHPEELLKGRNWAFFEGNLIFFDEASQQYMIAEIQEGNRYSFEDYMSLPEGAPFQLIEGELTFMAAPDFKHQEISGNIYFAIKAYLQNHNLGKVAYSPVDVKLDEKNVVQPDIIFVSIKRSSIIDRYIKGAPDFVVEILSKGNVATDRKKKRKLYGNFGVLEYWIVNPMLENIEIYHNHMGIMFKTETVGKTGRIQSKAIEGFSLDVSKIF